MPKRVNVIKEKKSRLKENEETPKQSATLDNGLDEGKKKPKQPATKDITQTTWKL